MATWALSRRGGIRELVKGVTLPPKEDVPHLALFSQWEREYSVNG